MDIFYDFEFHEYMYKPFPWSTAKHVIEPIALGMVTGGGREYYFIFNDFDLRSAWKDEWLRNNVLFYVWEELVRRRADSEGVRYPYLTQYESFTRESLHYHLKAYGHSRRQVAYILQEEIPDGNNRLFAYYSAYDHVALASLWGKMVNLPKQVPMFTYDLKAMLVEAAGENARELTGYPKVRKEHDALADAQWNKELHLFITDKPWCTWKRGSTRKLLKKQRSN